MRPRERWYSGSFPDPLGPHPHRDAEVRAYRHARRQRRRGRDAFPGGARPAGPGAVRRLRDRAWHDRRQPVLRRRHHHAGHLRALRRRGAEARDARPRPLRAAPEPSHHRGPVRGPEPRHGEGGVRVRPPDRAVVHRHGAGWPPPPARRPQYRGGLQSGPRHRLPPEPRDRRPPRARRRVPGGDRRRGAVRGHGPFRPPADPRGLVRPRSAGPGTELPRPGSDAAGPSRADRDSLLPALPVLGPPTDGAARHRGNGHRQPGGHHRHVLDHAAAMQLGLLPRMRVLRTSETEKARSTSPG